MKGRGEMTIQLGTVSVFCLLLGLTGCGNVTAPVDSSNHTEQTVDTICNTTTSTTPQPNTNPTPKIIVNPNKPQLNLTDSIYMISQSTGWDFTSAQGNIFGTDGILRTDDGGKSWTNITPLQLATKQNTYAGGEAVGVSNAWVVSANTRYTSVFKTSDGGKTWTCTNLPKAYLLAWMSFINAQTGWLLASPGPAAGQEPSDLYYTSNGGITWSEVATTQSDSLPLDDGKTGISFADAKTGWLTIDNGLHPGKVTLYVTHDGGHSWLPQDVSVPTQVRNQYAHPLPPSFSSPTSGILPIVFDGGKGSVFYFTSNGGNTWTCSSVVPLHRVSNLVSVSNEAVWVTDGHSIFVTGNGGGVWRQWTPFLSKNAGIIALSARRNETSTVVYTLQNGKVTQHDLNMTMMR
ncbi:hypothetical protein [Alicyclobacillus dauci]|uniref:Photosynthesis system II assembly factor Ycf48/Hcf136-like domain-containing protein n=1 Tax=Alicyclobacillus dauci TaxID=1475485 RepID=A0ABY6Z5Z1_9BACL|nr:hypothetical protein [Alicyclobacillus dauci]WAH38318.1 hypothetical protein NZD86_07495 [Alicyclobacillus dauci]